MVKAENIDDTLIQLRQINYQYLLFDSDFPGSEQESIHTTIKSLQSNTNCFETNEDETVETVLNKIEEHLHKEKTRGI